MKLKEHFSQDELSLFTQRSNVLAWWAILCNWLIIVGAFSLAALWTNPLTIFAAIIILGGRHLGLGVLMHECGHGTLFQSRSLNQSIGKWLCAAPVLYRIEDYMKNHLQHHALAGSADDPDLSRYGHYPVPAASLRRKIWRDLTGRTTSNFIRNSLRLNQVTFDENGKRRFSASLLWQQFHAQILTNIALFSILATTGNAWLYSLWVVAYFSVYMVFSRIRNLAEHAVVPDLTSPDPLLHTRTTIVRWWEKLSFAPNSVNYHLEHHLLASVPKYRLASFHQALMQKGLLKDADVILGYPTLIRKLVTPLG